MQALADERPSDPADQVGDNPNKSKRKRDSSKKGAETKPGKKKQSTGGPLKPKGPELAEAEGHDGEAAVIYGGILHCNKGMCLLQTSVCILHPQQTYMAVVCSEQSGQTVIALT